MKAVKYICLLMVMLLFSPSALWASEEAEYFSLQQAERLALENSRQLELARLNVLEAEFQFQQAEAAMLMQPSPVLILQAQAGLDLARQAHLMAKDDLRLEVLTDFYGILKMENLLEIAQEGLASAMRHEEIARKKLAAGTATRLDVIRATGSVLNAQAGVSQARHGLELSQMKFRQTLGVSLDAPVYPEPVTLEVDAVEIDLQEDIAFAMSHREEVKQLQVAVAVAATNVEVSDNDYTPVLTLEQARINLAKMETQLEQVKDLIMLDIRQSYLALQEAQERIGVLEKGVEEALEMIRLSELSYEANLITSNDLSDAQIAVISAQNDLVGATYDYNIAQARYFNAVARALRDDS